MVATVIGHYRHSRNVSWNESAQIWNLKAWFQSLILTHTYLYYRHVCIHGHLGTYEHPHTHAYSCALAHTHVHSHTHRLICKLNAHQTFTQANLYTHSHTHTCKLWYICIHICTFVQPHTHAHIYAWSCTHTLSSLWKTSSAKDVWVCNGEGLKTAIPKGGKASG